MLEGETEKLDTLDEKFRAFNQLDEAMEEETDTSGLVIADEPTPQDQSEFDADMEAIHEAVDIADVRAAAQQALNNIEKRKERRAKVGFSQWSAVDGGAAYTPVGGTQPTLPPGYYDIAIQNGQTFMVPVTSRDDDLVRFPGTVVDAVIEEIRTFWDREELFHRYGLPYKRGILLYGPPGSGKSCTLQMVARDVILRGGIVVQFRGVSAFLSGLRAVRDIQAQMPVVVLMEDIDEILDNNNQSAILNLLDGVESVNKVVFLATTNYPRKLGPRIYNRPSRFDRRFLVPHPEADARRLYLTHVAEGYDGEIDIDRMVEDTKGLSLAHAKELFVATKLLGSDYDETVRLLRTMSVQTDMDEMDLESPSTGGYA